MPKRRIIPFLLCAALLLTSFAACGPNEPEQNFSEEFGVLKGRITFNYRNLDGRREPLPDKLASVYAINTKRVPMDAPFDSPWSPSRGVWWRTTDEEGYYDFSFANAPEGFLPQGEYLVIMMRLDMGSKKSRSAYDALKMYDFLSEKELSDLSDKIGMNYEIYPSVIIGNTETVLNHCTLR